MEKNTTKLNAEERLAKVSELLKKRLYDITPEETKTLMNVCDVQLQKIKRGTGSKQTIRYSATLVFIPNVYEITIPLTLMEYNQICLKRNPNSVSIPDSLKLKAYYLPIEYTNVNSTTNEVKTSYQLKIILSDLVRKKQWLDQLYTAMWDSLVKIPFIKADKDIDEELDNVEDAI